MGITMFISLYTTRLILQGLGASDFGIYNTVGGAIAMLGFFNASLASATQRFMSYTEGEGDEEKKYKIFNVSYLLHFLLSLFVAFVLSVAGIFFFNGILNIPEDRLNAAYIVYSSVIISTVFTIMSVPYDAVLNSHENMRYYSIVGIGESILKLTVAFACINADYDKLIVYAILMALIPIISRIVLRVYCHKHYKECFISLRRYCDKETVRSMTSFAGWNFLSSMSSMTNHYGCGIVLNHYYGSLLNAAMGVAGQLDGMLHTVSSNMLKALAPVITKTEGAGSREKMIEYAKTGNKFSFFLFSVFCVPFFWEMPTILKLWLQDIPEWAIIFTRLQLVRTLLEQLTCTYATAIAAEGRIAKMKQINMIIDIIPICLISVLFHYGFTPTIMYIVNILFIGIGISCVKVYFMHTNCGMKYSHFFINQLLPLSVFLGVSMSMVAIIHFFCTPSIMRLLCICLLSVFSQIVLFYLIVLDKKEKKIILGLPKILFKK